MRRVLPALLLFFGLALAGGLDLGIYSIVSGGGFSGHLGFYVEGNPLAARGSLIFGEGGGLMAGLDLLYRPFGNALLEPYLGAGAQTLIARQQSVGGLQMAVGEESYAVGTLGLALRLPKFRPFAEFSYCYGASPYAKAGLGFVWWW
ncbi:hypothetical protein [Oceanithermus sp.]